jgi:hypothetical protein
MTFSIAKAPVTKASFRVVVTNAYKASGKSIVEATFAKTRSNRT